MNQPMNVIARIAAILGVTTTFGVSFSLFSASPFPDRAAGFQPNLAIAAFSPRNPPTLLRSPGRKGDLPTLVSQLSDKIDLTLLAKASAVFLQSDRYRTESEIQVKATSGSTSLTSTARVTTIVQTPNKFRAEIFFPDSGNSQQPDSIVVSDGKQVWIFRPGLKHYAVTPYQKFDQIDDNYWVGMSSLWFLEIPPDARKPIAEGALSDSKVQAELGLSDDLPVKGMVQTIDGQELYVYEYTDKEGFSVRAFVEPKTATLQQVVLAGKSEGFDVVITERILRRVANPSVNASTFQAPPRAGFKPVKTLAIGPL